ncbi:alpha/beta fold hydrolase [Sphingomonas sp. PAMC 26605]|uniref:alpha/beta fold hydrolase n=1 Tax=Sphingomonas sp. PAMC 26605 TaxID=1112214 RepID=UPI00026CD818|nr:alpha/beta hydrolase [Sphingomonas sp. PAMC 26605]
MKKALLATGAALALTAGAATAQTSPSTSATTTFHTVTVDGVKVFYREAGPKDAPAILLLHGYPSSSAMFATLIPLLADRYHLVAPDYPGFGLSDAPPPSQFSYTFEHLTKVVDEFTQTLGLKRYVLYEQDYGGPIGMRLTLAHPERVRAIIVQNAVAHEDGLGPAWAPRRAFWKDRAAYEDQVIGPFVSLAGTRMRHLGSSPTLDRYDPNAWLAEYAHLSQPGQRQIQSDLFYDYQSNVAAYPAWDAWLREHRTPLLVVWGRFDPSFDVAEAQAYRRDVPDAEVHVLDAGHFALDEKVDEIAGLIRSFLARTSDRTSKQ